jgi:hypothetical protein
MLSPAEEAAQQSEESQGWSQDRPPMSEMPHFVPTVMNSEVTAIKRRIAMLEHEIYKLKLLLPKL